MIQIIGGYADNAHCVGLNVHGPPLLLRITKAILLDLAANGFEIVKKSAA